MSKFSPSELIDEINRRRSYPERLQSGDLTKDGGTLAFSLVSVISDYLNAIYYENAKLESRVAQLERIIDKPKPKFQCCTGCIYRPLLTTTIRHDSKCSTCKNHNNYRDRKDPV